MGGGLIRAFTRHPVAPNLAMIVMLLAGAWALGQLTRQLLPAFQLNIINVRVAWTGTAAEDVEQSLTRPLEDQLSGLEGLRNLTSTSRNGESRLVLEYSDSVDMGRALDQVKEKVAQIRNLPLTSEAPQVSLSSRTEPVARLIIAGPVLSQLRPMVRRFETELRGLGLASVTVSGLPQEEIAIQIPSDRLAELELSLQEIAARVRQASRDVPAGLVGRAEVARQLRSLDQRRTVVGFEQLPLIAADSGRLITLGDIAIVERRALPGQATLYFNGKPAIELDVRRAEQADAIDVAAALYGWVEQAREILPPNVELTVYNEPWRQVDNRISLVVENGLMGLFLVAAVLYLFLNGRVAVWVAVGIPVSVMGALMALYLLGGSLNVISLFAIVMALGIIVDDAIVVAEEAVTLYQDGAGPASAAENAALRMLAPVIAASLTTIAAFMPLLTISGAAGSILFAIPLIIICVVMASLIECFIVLPGHLRHALAKTASKQSSSVRRRFDASFRRFRDNKFLPALNWAMVNRNTTISIAVASLLVTAGLLGGGQIRFSFFPQPDATTIFAEARFVAGSPEARVSTFLDAAISGLEAVQAEAGEPLIKLVVKKVGVDRLGSAGDHLGHLAVELYAVDQRDWSNADLIRAWRRNVEQPPGMEAFVIVAAAGGPPGTDLEVELTGPNPDVLKGASLALQSSLQGFDGVIGVRDNTAYGREQLIYALTPTGEAIGLTSESLGEQLRAAFDGELVQIFQDEGDEVEVRVVLAEQERDTLNRLETLPIALANGDTVPLSNVARLSYRRGFDTLRHSNGLLAVKIAADIDSSRNNANAVRAQLSDSVLPALVDRYGVRYSFKGDAENQAESLGDVFVALPLALLLIYIILAWVFASYIWPLAVLAVIPFGLVGALIGHWLMGFDLTLFSIFGFFGLSGIVINDSIILVTVYKQLREQGHAVVDAAVGASVSRFRAVVLTSITTVIGIMPLLAEQSLEAQFLKPMVISLGFGLIFSTFMVLFLLPTFLVGGDLLLARLAGVKSRFPRGSADPEDVLLAGKPELTTASIFPDSAATPGTYPLDRAKMVREDLT